MIKVTTDLRRRLSTVMFIATVLVVMCHVDDVLNLTHANRFDALPVRFLGGAFTDANVANFFFLSGLFLALHYGSRNWWEMGLVKRMRTLLVPYVAWCLIYVSMPVCLSVGKRLLLGLPLSESYALALLQQPDCGLTKIFGLGFLDAPYCFPLWYIKSLMWFIFVSPIFFHVLHRYGYKVLFVFIGSCYALATLLNLPVFRLPGFHIVGFACFLTGATVAFHPLKMLWFHSPFMPFAWLSCWVVSAVLLIVLPPEIKRFWRPVNIAIEVLMLHLFVSSIQWRVPDWLVRSAFIIYALHILILNLLRRTLIPQLLNLFPAILVYFLMLVFTVVVCVGISLLLKRYFPKLAVILSGGRS